MRQNKDGCGLFFGEQRRRLFLCRFFAAFDHALRPLIRFLQTQEPFDEVDVFFRRERFERGCDVLQELLQLMRLLVLLAFAHLRRFAAVALRRIERSQMPGERLVLTLDVLGDLPRCLYKPDLDGGMTLQNIGESLLLCACHIFERTRERVFEILRPLFLRGAHHGDLTRDLFLHHGPEGARIDSGVDAKSRKVTRKTPRDGSDLPRKICLHRV